VSAEIATKPIKTLLVEDDPDLIDMAMELLEMTGCEVTPVLSPEEAMDSIETKDDFELLFTDYRFPSVVTGIDLADKVTDISPKIKVIIATGYDQQAIQAQASEHYRVLYKPYRLEALQDLLKQLFPITEAN